MITTNKLSSLLIYPHELLFEGRDLGFVCKFLFIDLFFFLNFYPHHHFSFSISFQFGFQFVSFVLFLLFILFMVFRVIIFVFDDWFGKKIRARCWFFEKTTTVDFFPSFEYKKKEKSNKNNFKGKVTRRRWMAQLVLQRCYLLYSFFFLIFFFPPTSPYHH